jgi:hypothetical protein
MWVNQGRPIVLISLLAFLPLIWFWWLLLRKNLLQLTGDQVVT